MPITIRLTDTEQERIAEKTREVNRKLIEKGKPAMRESELVHVLLAKALASSKVAKDGQVILGESSPIVETKVQYY